MGSGFDFPKQTHPMIDISHGIPMIFALYSHFKPMIFPMYSQSSLFGYTIYDWPWIYAKHDEMFFD